MPDGDSITTPGRDPDDAMRSVWTGKGRHRSTPHSDHTGKCGQAWSRSEIKATYPACDLVSMREIIVNELGQYACPECGFVAERDSRGFIVCKCTVWNAGEPRPRRAPKPKPDVIRARQWRTFAKRGRC